MKKKNRKYQEPEYPHVFPNIEDWPIYKLSEIRPTFVKEINDFTFDTLVEKHGEKLGNVIGKAIYQEKIRLKEEPWKVDPPNEQQFWRRIKKRILNIPQGDNHAQEKVTAEKDILRIIINRYSEEIVSSFKIKTFLFARKFLTFFFNTLLFSSLSLKSFRVRAGQNRVQNRLIIKGYIDHIRSLMEKGTVIIVPTHFSNLDSILIGYAMDLIGLPSFSYGAGLNLYNSGYAAYFMNRIGTYRVDRRKKNPIYLETLKAMSNLSIQKGTNSLFFPGGTRSRSGAIEDRLKLGLLGTAVEAQRGCYQNGKEDKIFIVPLILSYHFVLEAQFLIEQHLRRVGREKYMRAKDNFLSLRKILKFAWTVYSEENDIIISVGKPMDVLGNPVDESGVSYDNYGNEIDVKDYFKSDEKVVKNLQRESEYTKILSKAIVERYLIDNIVLSSHLVAFAAFNLLKQYNSSLDLYAILRLPTSDFVFTEESLMDVIKQLQEELINMEAADKVKLSESITLPVKDLIYDGIERMGNFHVAKPLKKNKKGQIVSDNFNLLYYYHNRLDSYGLEEKISWKTHLMEVL